jgi:alpha-galactosidase
VRVPLAQSQPEVIALLANKELINVNQSCEGARPVALCETGAPVWVSNYIGSADKALALFNLKDEEIEVSATLASIGINGGAKTLCIFGNKDLGAVAGGVVKVKLAPHSAALLRVTPV